MEKGTPKFTINTGTDLAFALVVFISYFATFSNASIAEPFLITVIIFLGIAYITTGIYGFSYTQKSGNNLSKLLYFGIQLILGGLIVYYGKGIGFNSLILLPLVAHTAMLLDQDWMLAANVAIILTFIVAVLLYSHDLQVVWVSAPIFFAGQVFILIFTQMAVTEQKARVKLENLASQLSEANKHLNEYADRVQEMTIAQERNRLAREIHDGLGHYLTTINMQIQAASKILESDKEKAKKMLSNAQNLSSEALLDVRNSVFALRQEPADLLPLHKRIEELSKITSLPGRKIVVEIVGSPRELSPQIEMTLYRVAQETINNVNKHSHATQLDIVLDYQNEDSINFVAADNGIGVKEFGRGYGLIGIQERVKLINGTTDIETSYGNGFKIMIKIPSENDNKNTDC